MPADKNTVSECRIFQSAPSLKAKHVRTFIAARMAKDRVACICGNAICTSHCDERSLQTSGPRCWDGTLGTLTHTPCRPLSAVRDQMTTNSAPVTCHWRQTQRAGGPCVTGAWRSLTRPPFSRDAGQSLSPWSSWGWGIGGMPAAPAPPPTLSVTPPRPVRSRPACSVCIYSGGTTVTVGRLGHRAALSNTGVNSF